MNGFTFIIVGIVLVVSLVIYFEMRIAKKRNLQIYTISDSVTNISCGIQERIFDFFYAVLFLQASTYLYENVAPWHIPINIFTSILALLIFDFVAYWFHRFSHEVNLLWAAHIVHHQSEELNLTTVFRVSFFAVVYRSMFFIWLPLIGLNAFTLLICGLILAIYQLFTHSRLIGKLGFLEIFMTTPSHHRVHHGRNEDYMYSNYGHIFIFWDKLFGTFTLEKEEPKYGITSGFESTDPFNASLSYWENLIERAKRTKRPIDKLRVFFKGPAWTPDDVEHLPSEYKTDVKGNRLPYKVKVKKEIGIYILINTLFTFLLFIILIKGIGNKDTTLMELFRNPNVMWLVAIILFSHYSHGKMFEQTFRSIFIDAMRLLVVAVSIILFRNELQSNLWIVYSILGFCIAMLLWLFRISSLYRETLGNKFVFRKKKSDLVL
jgi:alkylglycerol monooxygenase